MFKLFKTYILGALWYHEVINTFIQRHFKNHYATYLS